MAKLRGAVIGAGNMGRHHVRIMGQHPDIDLIAVVDPDIERAMPLAKASGSTAIASIAELADIDLAIIATPTQFHVEAALELINRGVSVLIEKPLAESPEQAQRLVDAATAKGVTLAVGHVERFNPAVATLAHLISNPNMISIERLSPYTPRIHDSVIYDLAIHDVDLACWLAGGYPTKVAAAGTRVFSDTIDASSAVLTFESGCVVTLQTSRVTQDKVRKISVSENERYIVADTLRQDIEIKRQTQVSYEGEGDSLTFAQASVIEIPTLDRSGEPLRRELDDFVFAVIHKTRPTVSGEDGLAAVKLVHEIERLCTE